LAEMLGLKTGTITSLTRFRTSRPAPAPEPPAKNHLPLYAGIAATLTLTAGVAWYLTQPTAAATNAPPVPVPSVATKAPETEPALAVKPPPPPAPTAPTQPPTPEQPAANMAVAAQAEPKPAEPTKPKPAEESIPPAPATAPPLAAAPSAPDTPVPIATVKPDSTPESAPASAVSMSTVPSFNFGTPIQLAAPPATIPFPTTPSNDSPSSAPAVHAQPNPGEPPAGFWTLEELYPHPPFSDYSANGRKYLLYRTQSLLKQRGLYNSNVDGREGKGTHLAIRLFQVESGLQPTGMLDEPTLVALDLDDTPDNPTWTTRSISGNSRSGPRRPRGPKEEPGFWKKFGDTVTKPFR
jgi:hypothetical protein